MQVDHGSWTSQIPIRCFPVMGDNRIIVVCPLLFQGKIYEWDGKSGAVEIYSKNGKEHLGEFNHETGERTKKGKSKENRTVEP